MQDVRETGVLLEGWALRLIEIRSQVDLSSLDEIQFCIQWWARQDSNLGMSDEAACLDNWVVLPPRGQSSEFDANGLLYYNNQYV